MFRKKRAISLLSEAPTASPKRLCSPELVTFPSTLFTNALNVCSSHNVQVSHTHTHTHTHTQNMTQNYSFVCFNRSATRDRWYQQGGYPVKLMIVCMQLLLRKIYLTANCIPVNFNTQRDGYDQAITLPPGGLSPLS